MLFRDGLSGGGESELVLDGEGMEAKVVRQLERALQPLLADVRVDWGDLTPHLKYPSAPEKLKPLYSGSRALMFGVFRVSRYGIRNLGVCDFVRVGTWWLWWWFVVVCIGRRRGHRRGGDRCEDCDRDCDGGLSVVDCHSTLPS